MSISLSNQSYQMVAARMLGNSFPKIANDHSITLDQATYRIKKHSNFMNLFEKTETENEFVFKFKEKNKQIFIKEFDVLNVIEETGNEEDGVILTNFDWSYDLRKSDIQAEQSHSFELDEYDCVLIPGKLVVGKVVKTSEFFEPDSSWKNEGFYRLSPETAVPEEKPIEDEIDYSKAVWNASNKFISITLGRDVINANSEHPKFKEALECLFNDDIKKASELLNVEEAVKKYVKGNILIENGSLYYKGIHLKNGLAKRIIERMLSGQDFEFYLPFLNNLMLNPSNLAVTRLFDFLEANDIEITKDGYFLAYKRINANYTDVYSGTIDNSVGQLVSMDRNLVNDDDEQTCSHGLHVCSKAYLQHFHGAKVVICKVHPRDVVSIPVDYNNAKMRVCQYEVLKEV